MVFAVVFAAAFAGDAALFGGERLLAILSWRGSLLRAGLALEEGGCCGCGDRLLRGGLFGAGEGLLLAFFLASSLGCGCEADRLLGGLSLSFLMVGGGGASEGAETDALDLAADGLLLPLMRGSLRLVGSLRGASEEASLLLFDLEGGGWLVPRGFWKDSSWGGGFRDEPGRKKQTNGKKKLYRGGKGERRSGKRKDSGRLGRWEGIGMDSQEGPFGKNSL